MAYSLCTVADFDMFFGILIFEPKWRFCICYSLCIMADFQNALFTGIFRVFLERFFAQNNSKWFIQWILTCFFLILTFEPKWRFCMGYSLCMMADFQNALLSQIEDFPWLIVFAWWPNFKLLSFLEYFVFFGTVFSTEQLLMIYTMHFDMFFWNFNF